MGIGWIAHHGVGVGPAPLPHEEVGWARLGDAEALLEDAGGHPAEQPPDALRPVCRQRPRGTGPGGEVRGGATSSGKRTAPPLSLPEPNGWCVGSEGAGQGGERGAEARVLGRVVREPQPCLQGGGRWGAED